LSENEIKNEEDCPAELINLFDSSKSEWRKAVIKEFIELHKWRQNMTRKLGRIMTYEKIIIALLTIIGGAVVSQWVIPKILEVLAGLA